MDIALTTIFCTSFVLALSGAVMPGPLLTVTISESSKRGGVTGPLVIFGHGLLELVLIAGLLSGLAPFLVRDDVFIFISLIGSAVLLWMGIGMLRSLSGLRLEYDPPSEKTKNLIMVGIVLSLINPYWLIWWASIGLGYIMHSFKFGLIGIAAFFAGHILADLAWYSIVSFGIARGRHLLSNSVYRKLIGGCASFLILFSCWFFYNGFQKIVTL